MPTSPYVVGSAIDGGSSLIGNAINFASQMMTNRMNRQMFEKSLDFNWRSMKDQQFYNSPYNQRKMLEEAGYSPYSLFMSNGQASSGMSSSGSLPNLQAPQVQMPTSIASSMVRDMKQGEGIDSQVSVNDANVRNIDQDTEAKRLENQTRLAEAYIRMEEGKARIKDTNARANVTAMQGNLLKDTYDSQVEFIKGQRDEQLGRINQMTANCALMAAQEAKTRKETAWIDKVNTASVMLMTGQYVAAIASAELSRAAAVKQFSSALVDMANKHGIDINNRIADETADFLITNTKINLLRNGIGGFTDLKSLQNLTEYGTMTPYSTYNRGWNFGPFGQGTQQGYNRISGPQLKY